MVLYRDWSSLAALAAGLLSLAPARIFAQTSDATCLSSFSWMDNSKDQSPCVVGAYLLGACNDGQFNVGSLSPGTNYTGPYAKQQNQCQCSSVTYNVLSACGLCQNCTIISWSVWDFNCSTVYPEVFPPGIPNGTAVPQWAFQDVKTSDLFNVTLAQSVGNSPESTGASAPSAGSSNAPSTDSSSATSTGFLSAPSTSSLSAPSTSSLSAPSTGSLSAASAGSSASSTAVPSGSSSTSSVRRSNSRAIAGGVVGGVVGVALIAGAVTYLLRRRKHPAALLLQDDTTQYVTSPILARTAHYNDGTSTPFTPQMVQPTHRTAPPSTQDDTTQYVTSPILARPTHYNDGTSNPFTPQTA